MLTLEERLRTLELRVQQLEKRLLKPEELNQISALKSDQARRAKQGERLGLVIAVVAVVMILGVTLGAMLLMAQPYIR